MKLFDFLVFIDDDSATNYYHEHILNEYALCDKYVFFSSAEDALVFFKENQDSPDFIPPDLIFSDINMPKLDGWDFVKGYEELNHNLNSKVYMLTTSSNPHEMEKIQEFQTITGYKEKPLSKEMLQNIAKTLEV